MNDPINEHNNALITQVLTDFFSVFDNRANQEPNWSLLPRLCTTDIKIVKCEAEHEEVYDLDGFINPRKVILSSGELIDFHETLIDAQIQCFGRIAQAFVTYKKQGTHQGNPLLGYGKKSIQLLNMNGIWRIFSVTWFDETDNYLIEEGLKG